jgi:diguanylate cyclase (GGDEF)-like protein
MRRYVCVPIIAHGETIGLLHIEPSDAAINKPETDWNQRWDLSLLCGEQISLALANVRLRQELIDQSLRDQLTSLSNRRWFVDAAHREILRASKTGAPLSLISLDVDHFKRFNDNHGHDAGDTVLREMGKLMAEFFRKGQYPCRIGGEEFVVLCPGMDKAAALTLAEAFRTSISGLTLNYDGMPLPSITVSGGVASYPEDGTGVTELGKTADEALYRAKSGGRDRVIAAGA